MPRRTLLEVLAPGVLTLAFVAPTAHAEPPTVPTWMRVPATFMLQSELPAGAAPAPAPAPDARRGAYRIAAGSGLLVAGVLHAIMFGNRQVCYASDQRIPSAVPLGTLVAAGGLALTVHGTMKLRSVPRANRHLRAAEVPVYAGAAALATAAAASGLLFGTVFRAFDDCIAS